MFARQKRQEEHFAEKKMFTNIGGLEELGESASWNCSVWLKAFLGEEWQAKEGEVLKDQITEDYVFIIFAFPNS